MEATFYEESLSAPMPPQQKNVGCGYNAKALKMNMTLDLNDPIKHLKPHLRAKALDILTSPDVGLLKLTSPELERLIVQSCNSLTTPTPSQFIPSKNATDEQEGFAEGFVKALEELHHQPHMPVMDSAGQGMSASTDMTPVTSDQGNVSLNTTVQMDPPEYSSLSSLGRAPAYTDSSSIVSYAAMSPQNAPGPRVPCQHPLQQAYKEELQRVPDMNSETPPLSPIDMENQERIKAERKRMRNRIAASKCRKRKLERLSRLEEKVKFLKTQNTELCSTANILRDEVAQLKLRVMDHVNSGCHLMLTQRIKAF